MPRCFRKTSRVAGVVERGRVLVELWSICELQAVVDQPRGEAGRSELLGEESGVGKLDGFWMFWHVLAKASGPFGGLELMIQGSRNPVLSQGHAGCSFDRLVRSMVVVSCAETQSKTRRIEMI